jgi:hypothetical protein
MGDLAAMQRIDLVARVVQAVVVVAGGRFLAALPARYRAATAWAFLSY